MTDVVNANNPVHGTNGGDNTQDKVFLLSIDEVTNTNYGFAGDIIWGQQENTRKSTNTAYAASGGHTRGSMESAGTADTWWLRSPGRTGKIAAVVYGASEENNTVAGYVSTHGYPVDDDDDGVRPAVNVDLGQVLFVSPAVCGKPDEIVKTSENDPRPMMTAVSGYNGSDWKLTVLDSSRSNFYADFRGFKNGECKIGYANAKSTENDVISGMIVDADGHVKYYGVFGYANPAPLTVFPFNISAQYEVGDRIYIFNEEQNGDKQTDYSSALIDITPEKLPEGLTATVGQRLKDVAIPNPEGNTEGTWKWDDQTTEINTAGEDSFAATFTPSNTDAFETIRSILMIISLILLLIVRLVNIPALLKNLDFSDTSSTLNFIAYVLPQIGTIILTLMWLMRRNPFLTYKAIAPLIPVAIMIYALCFAAECLMMIRYRINVDGSLKLALVSRLAYFTGFSGTAFTFFFNDPMKPCDPESEITPLDPESESTPFNPEQDL